MIHVHLNDAVEQYGYSPLYDALIAAIGGNPSPIMSYGFYGVDPRSAQQLARMLDRAYCGKADQLAAQLIAKVQA